MIFASKRVQRVTNFSLALMLVLSTISASVPFLFAKTANAAGSSVYTGIPAVQPATYPSIGFAATSTKELGDRVTLAGSNRHLDNVTASLTSWACETGEWQSNNCVTTPGATFSHPVTVNLYAVNANGSVGSVIATKTQTIAAQYRPSADPTCVGADLGKWRADNGTCYNGKAFDVNFDFSAQHKTLPNEVIATVAYDGNASNAAKALNVSLINNVAPTVGTDTDPTTMYEDSTYPGTTAGLKAADYSPYHLAMNITASPTNVGPTAVFNTPTPVSGYVHGTIDTNTTFSDDYGMGGYTVRFWKDAYEVADGGTLVKDCSSFPGAYLLGTSQNVSCSLDVTSYPNGTKFFLSAQVLDGDNVWGNATIRSYTVDNTKPVIYVKSGANNVLPASLTSDTFKTVSFKVYDNVQVDKVTINGVVKDLTDAQWSDVNGVTKGVFGAVEGENIIVLYDVAGNTSSYTFTIDTTAPQGTLTYSPSTLTNNSVIATLTTNEAIDQSALPGTWLKVSDTVYRKSYPVNATQVVTLKDSVGNTSTVTVAITWIDKTAPTGSLSYSPSTLTNGDVTATLTTSEEIQIPAGWTQQTTTTYTKVYSANAFETVAFKDLANNNGTTAVSINWIDKTAPAAPVITNSPVIVNNSVADAQATWSHDGVDVDHYEYREYMSQAAADADIDGNTASYWIVSHNADDKSQTVGNSWTGEQTLYYRIVAIDAAGNRSVPSELGTVIIDKVAPVAPTVSADGIANSGDSTNELTVNVTWSAPAGASTYDYRVWTNANGSIYNSEDNAYEVQGLTGNARSGAFTEGEGSYFVQVRAIDATGNPSPWSTAFVVVYDVTGPEIVANGYTQNGNVFTPDYSLTEDVDFTWTAAESNPTGVTFDDEQLNPDFTVTQDGNYSFTLTATDSTGNSTSRVLSFTYTAPAPVVTPESGTTTDNAPSGSAPVPTGFTGVIGATANQAVLGATDNTEAAQNGTSDVAGATDDKTASAVDGNNGMIFGLAWYWWILILAALAALAWFIIAAIRRRNEEEA